MHTYTEWEYTSIVFLGFDSELETVRFAELFRIATNTFPKPSFTYRKATTNQLTFGLKPFWPSLRCLFLSEDTTRHAG